MASTGANSFPTIDTVADWARGIYYRVGDIVLHGTNLYVCLSAHGNQEPSFPSGTYWQWLWSTEVTLSTSDPSGTPSDGDIWIKRET